MITTEAGIGRDARSLYHEVERTRAPRCSRGAGVGDLEEELVVRGGLLHSAGEA